MSGCMIVGMCLAGVLTAASVAGGSSNPAGATGRASPGLETRVAVVSAEAATDVSTIFVGNNGGSTVTSYGLAVKGNVRPKVTISRHVSSPQGLAFDHSGNLWVAGAGSVVEYSRSQLTEASPMPAVVISPRGSVPGLALELAGLAFDSSGDLWVDGYGNNTVFEYTQSQLTKSGSPAPNVTIAGNDINTPFGVAFDRSGNLWVSNEGNDDVVEYTQSQLTKSGSPTPKTELFAGPGSEGIAFDSSGELWVAVSGSVVEYERSQLTEGSPSPRVTITGPLQEPHGLAFDSSGGLWVADYSAGTLFEFSELQLRKSGSPTPHATLSKGLQGPVALAIGP